MASLFSRQRNPNMEKALFDWSIVLQYDVKAKYLLISRKFSGMKFFHLSVRLTNEKPDAFVCPFDKPIKSLYFRSFVVSVLFARFISRSYENRSIVAFVADTVENIKVLFLL